MRITERCQAGHAAAHSGCGPAAVRPGRLRWGGHARPGPGGRHRGRHAVQLLPHEGGDRHVAGRRGPWRGPRRLRPERRGGESLEEDLFALIAAELRSLKPHRGCLRPVLEDGAQPDGRGPRPAPEGESIRTDHLETVGASSLGTARRSRALRGHALVLDLVHRRAGLLGVRRLAAPGGHPGRPGPCLKMFVRSLPESRPTRPSARRRKPSMNPNLAELLAALPAAEDEADEGLDAAQLQRLFDRLGRRRVPLGALHRLGPSARCRPRSSSLTWPGGCGAGSAPPSATSRPWWRPTCASP